MKRFGNRGMQIALVLGLLVLVWASPAGLASEPKVRFRDMVYKSFEEGNHKELASVIGVSAPIQDVIALEYKVLLLVDGKEVAVDPKVYQFKIGDKIRLTIQPLSKSYIYIFHIGASGKHSFLLPQADQEPPCVEAKANVPLPSDGYFEFTTPPGDEKLLVVASEKPVPDRAVLAKVLTKDQSQDTPEEREVRKRLNATVEANLKSVQEQEAEKRDKVVKFRGLIDGPEGQHLAHDVQARDVARGTIEVPPQNAGEGTMAMSFTTTAAGQAKGQSNLLVTIPLVSKPGAP